jgi:hypothetical protein
MCLAIRGNLARRYKKYTNEKSINGKNLDNLGRLPKIERTYVINDVE